MNNERSVMAIRDSEGWLKSYKQSNNINDLRMACYWLSEALRFATANQSQEVAKD